MQQRVNIRLGFGATRLLCGDPLSIFLDANLPLRLNGQNGALALDQKAMLSMPPPRLQGYCRAMYNAASESSGDERT